MEIQKITQMSLSFKYKSNDPNVIQGISFNNGNITFKGSDIDRSFSYSKLNTKLVENSLKAQQTTRLDQSKQNPKRKFKNGI